jgi:hypothetical protein
MGSGFVPALVAPAAMVDKPAYVPCVSACTARFGIGSCIVQLHFQGQSEFASDGWYFLVFRGFDTHGYSRPSLPMMKQLRGRHLSVKVLETGTPR